MSERKIPGNPFRYGREAEAKLIDFVRKGFESAGATIAAGALERQHFLRQDLAGATPTWRFEDPFMRAWLATLANQ